MFRKLIFLLICLQVLQGQAQKNSWYIGGSAGFSSGQTKQITGGVTNNLGKGTFWNFSPEFGTFITEHFQTGLAIILQGENGDNQDPASPRISKDNSYGASIYGRYFFGKNSFKPFAGINVAALSGKKELELLIGTSKSDIFTFTAGFNAGFGYSLSERFTALGSFGFLGFSHFTEKPIGGSDKFVSTLFDFNVSSLGNRFTIGIYYTL